MVNRLILPLALLAALHTSAQNIGINVNGASPHPSALLDIDASAIAGTKRGLLIPRMTSTERNAIPAPATGLLVYDNSTQGIWHFDGTGWVPLLNGTTGWSTTGNAGTTVMNFLGTTDNAPLRFRVNNAPAGLLDPFDYNTTFGIGAGAGLSTGQGNTFVGIYAGLGNSTGIGNTFLGISAGYANTTASENTFVGMDAGRYNTTAGSNTYIGVRAGYQNTTGINNVCVGTASGQANITASNNTFVGTSAGYSNTTGDMNVYMGRSAARLGTTGANNVCIGRSAGFNLGTGMNNTYLGADAGLGAAGLTNSAAIGYNAQVTASNSMVLGGTGTDAVNVGIGVTAPGYALHVISDAAGSTPVAFRNLNNSSVSGVTCLGGAGTLAGVVGWANLTNAYAPQSMTFGSLIASPATFLTNSTERMRIDAAGLVGINTTTPAAQLEVNGYTKLGSNAPAIRMVKLTGTTAASQGGSVNIPHGVTPTKILAVDVLIEYTPGSWVPTSYTGSLGYMCNFYINGANVTLWNLTGASANILSKPLKVLVTYEE